MIMSNPNLENIPNNVDEEDGETLDCAICLQSLLHPVALPCNHKFCFLCVKGVASRNRRCAICRSEIPLDFIYKPSLLKSDDLRNTTQLAFEDGQQWFYEGRQGWWQYDERTSREIEKAFREEGKPNHEVLIAGHVYIIDFENMVQYRKNEMGRKRKIKRDIVSCEQKLGVAGLKIDDPGEGQPTQSTDDRLPRDGAVSVDSVPRPVPRPPRRDPASRQQNLSGDVQVASQQSDSRLIRTGQRRRE